MTREPTTERSDWSAWPNFTPPELRCRGSGLVRIHPGFLDLLQALRTAFARPMGITSGCRSTAYNATVGGHPRSLHVCDQASHPGQLGALAVDVRIGDAATAAVLARLALERGWSVGVPNLRRGFVHLDRRDLVGLPQGVFGY